LTSLSGTGSPPPGSHFPASSCSPGTTAATRLLASSASCQPAALPGHHFSASCCNPGTTSSTRDIAFSATCQPVPATCGACAHSQDNRAKAAQAMSPSTVKV